MRGSCGGAEASSSSALTPSAADSAGIGMDYRYPTLPGIEERWGRAVFHCPFCHGWEHRDEPLGVLELPLNRRSAGGRATMTLGGHPYLRCYPASVSACRLMTICATRRETSIATWPSPISCSSITTARAKALTGTTSLSPVLVSVVKLR